jgi:hypothetical protein
MIHIATVHWNTDRWASLQREYFARHIKGPYRMYAWLNNVPNVPAEDFYYATREPVGPHAVKLNLLADLICHSAAPDDVILFIDGDAFPVGDIEPLLAEKLERHKLIAVQRLENNGDRQPHPCFCATTVKLWRQIKGDWHEGHQWTGQDGKTVTDVGGNLLKAVNDHKIDWLPLLRSNKRDLHPVFFAIYGGIVYHHGAGFRKMATRADSARFSGFEKVLYRMIPHFRRKRQRKIEADNAAMSEGVFAKIKAGPAFTADFM